MDTNYLIVGGGMTADAAVKGIREHDGNGSIVLVGSELHPRTGPPLTKGLWSGGDEAKIWKHTADAGAEVVLGRTIVSLDLDEPARPTTPVASTAKVLLATGGTPGTRRRRRAGHLLPHARRFSQAEADRRRRRAHRCHRWRFIGSELAASLTERARR
jgi:hypothetical protein